mmetsp:Transcript_74237/g.131108  ORF Transcript_74237/g.131108 Transcript_74237/m.131108 type:complete len:282 (+) Transcript_74237:357-1202(+)
MSVALQVLLQVDLHPSRAQAEEGRNPYVTARAIRGDHLRHQVDGIPLPGPLPARIEGWLLPQQLSGQGPQRLVEVPLGDEGLTVALEGLVHLGADEVLWQGHEQWGVLPLHPSVLHERVGTVRQAVVRRYYHHAPLLDDQPEQLQQWSVKPANRSHPLVVAGLQVHVNEPLARGHLRNALRGVVEHVLVGQAPPYALPHGLISKGAVLLPLLVPEFGAAVPPTVVGEGLTEVHVVVIVGPDGRCLVEGLRPLRPPVLVVSATLFGPAVYASVQPKVAAAQV